MKRPAYTLIEILAVIVILLILLAVSIPLLRMGLQGRHTNEAARIVQTMLQQAQAQAAETGRPVGLHIARDPQRGDAYNLRLAASPAPYAGDLLGSTCAVDGGGGYGNPGTAIFAGPVPWEPTVSLPPGTAGMLPTLCRAGDRIRFQYRGPQYRILSIAGSTLTFTSDSFPGPPRCPPQFDAAGNVVGLHLCAYQIERQPEATGRVVSLPTQASIDLASSGAGAAGLELGGAGDVTIMFSPLGDMDRVYYDGQPHRLRAPLYLLVGAAPQVNTNNPGALDANLNNGEALWVVVTPFGHIATDSNIPWVDIVVGAAPTEDKAYASRTGQAPPP